LPSILTVTPLGIGIGFFPILDIALSSQLSALSLNHSVAFADS